MTNNVGQEFVVTRSFAAPRDLVWRAHTEVERLKQWWGPKGFDMLAAKLDLKPGGVFHYGMRAPNGTEMWGKFIFREVTPQTRLAYVVSFSDATGGSTRNPWKPGWPLEVLTIVTFEEQDGKTLLTITGHPINCTDDERKLYEENFSGMQMGFKGTLDQLDIYLAEQQK